MGILEAKQGRWSMNKTKMALEESSYLQPEEQELLQQLQMPLSFERAFSQLVQQYQERLYWHLRGMLGPHEEADEVLQNTFIKVYKGIDKFRGQSKLYTWLYRIATNEALSHLRKRKRHRTESLELLDHQAPAQADSYLPAEDIQNLLQEAIALLPDRQRQVFLLRYYDEMPYQDMAEVLELSVGSLKASYHHAVKKIENYIKQQ